MPHRPPSGERAALAEQQAEFTSEGAPPPGKVGTEPPAGGVKPGPAVSSNPVPRKTPP